MQQYMQLCTGGTNRREKKEEGRKQGGREGGREGGRREFNGRKRAGKEACTPKWREPQ